VLGGPEERDWARVTHKLGTAGGRMRAQKEGNRVRSTHPWETAEGGPHQDMESKEGDSPSA